jgi:hypothetical protein
LMHLHLHNKIISGRHQYSLMKFENAFFPEIEVITS